MLRNVLQEGPGQPPRAACLGPGLYQHHLDLRVRLRARGFAEPGRAQNLGHGHLQPLVLGLERETELARGLRPSDLQGQRGHGQELCRQKADATRGRRRGCSQTPAAEGWGPGWGRGLSTRARKVCSSRARYCCRSKAEPWVSDTTAPAAGREGGVSPAGPSPARKQAGTSQGGRAAPALRGAAGRSPQRSQHCPSGRRGSRHVAWGQTPPRGWSSAAQIHGCACKRGAGVSTEKARARPGESAPRLGRERAGDGGAQRHRPDLPPSAGPGRAPLQPPRGGPPSPRRCRRRSPTGPRRPRGPRSERPARGSAGGPRGTPGKPPGPRRARTSAGGRVGPGAGRGGDRA